MKKILITVLCCGLVFAGGYVLATNINASEITYNNTNVESALDTLYNLANTGSNLSSDAKLFLTDTNHSITLTDLLESSNLYTNSTTVNSIISNSIYTNLILNDNNAINALDNSNPIVSTDTSKAIYSSYYASTCDATSQCYPANAFDDRLDTYWNPAAGVSYLNQYIGYDFGEAVWVYKMIINMGDGKQNTDYVLEASNDRNGDYVILKDGLHQGGGTKTILPNNYNQKYRYYRIRMLSSIAQSGSGNTIVSYLRFYAK